MEIALSRNLLTNPLPYPSISQFRNQQPLGALHVTRVFVMAVLGNVLSRTRLFVPKEVPLVDARPGHGKHRQPTVHHVAS